MNSQIRNSNDKGPSGCSGQTSGFIALSLGLLLFCLPATAQVPFFNGGVAAYEPEIDTVTSGAQMVVAPTVSADRKYVTIGGQFQQAQIIAIETIPFVRTTFAGGNPQSGLLGGAVPMPPSPGIPSNLLVSRPVPVNMGKAPILNQHGMTLVALVQ